MGTGDIEEVSRAISIGNKNPPHQNPPPPPHTQQTPTKPQPKKTPNRQKKKPNPPTNKKNLYRFKGFNAAEKEGGVLPKNEKRARDRKNQTELEMNFEKRTSPSRNRERKG